MNTTSSIGARRTPRRMLPAVLAVPVTIVCGSYTLVALASAALNDVTTSPNLGWLSTGLDAQAVLAVTAITLLIVALTRAGQRRVVPVLSWLVIALSVATAAASFGLGTSS
jgi:hypothetical protein